MAGKGNANRRTGAFWERQAAEYLEQKGYQILERNFCSYFGEIDIIARQGSYLVFVEVKYRAGTAMGEPQEAVDVRKQRKISRTASYYCMTHRIPQDQPCRFDVAACCAGEWVVIRNAFDYVQ